MKKKLLSALLVATCVVSMAACGSNKTEKEAKDDKIIVGTEAGFAPYEYMKGNEVVGIDMDIAKAIADDMGKSWRSRTWILTVLWQRLQAER